MEIVKNKYQVQNIIISHNGIKYPRNSIIELTEPEAKRLEKYLIKIEEPPPVKEEKIIVPEIINNEVEEKQPIELIQPEPIKLLITPDIPERPLLAKPVNVPKKKIKINKGDE